MPSTASMENVVCIFDLLEIITPYLQRTTNRTYAIKPIVQLTTTLQFFAARVWRCPWPFKIICVAMYRRNLKEIWLTLFYLLKKDGNFCPRPIFLFFVFKFVDMLYVLLYTSIISLHVIKHVVFCGHLWPLLNK